jgi:hypothetical protein
MRSRATCLIRLHLKGFLPLARHLNPSSASATIINKAHALPLEGGANRLEV